MDTYLQAVTAVNFVCDLSIFAFLARVKNNGLRIAGLVIFGLMSLMWLWLLVTEVFPVLEVRAIRAGVYRSGNAVARLVAIGLVLWGRR